MDANVERLISVAEAMAILDAQPVSPRVRSAALLEAAGMVLAGEIRADRDYPPFDKSVMDGYAVRAGDVAVAPAMLDVVGEIAAGQWPERGVGAGEAMAIMTGAPLPPGADAVIPIEWTDGAEVGGRVRIDRTASAGQMIVRQGSDCAAGAVVLPVGTRLGPAQVAVAASVGAATVSVYARPRAAVMSSGDEIVPIAATPGAAQIRNSNSAMLAALIRGRGWCAECRELSAPADDPVAIAAALRSAREFDAIFLSGGMSMGKYDFVPRVLAELGVQIKISKLRIKPGKPFAFGVWEHDRGKTCVFGLPGNPVSAFVCTLRLASRILRRMAGEPAAMPRRSAKLAAAVEGNGSREFYQPGNWQDGRVVPLRWKGSGDVFSLSAADVLIVRPENDPPRAAGDEVEVVEL
ncbi:MAG TPA: gephyrin-like molybdotransferase Glp [Tepidisphaeraceae bacterium]|jgi:molybdopterin molybdotransferase|nr:gephyrin-like molybdotransferase Glp [Tepidisphaeraceae bacterium]